MLSLAPNFAVPRHDKRKSLDHLFWYAEPFQHGLGNQRNVHLHKENIVTLSERVLWRDFRSRLGTIGPRLDHLRTQPKRSVS